MAKKKSDSLKRLKCEYDKPSNISKLVTYFLNFLLGMLADPLFAPIETLLENAKSQVEDLNTAEIAAAGKVPGSAAARDMELLNTNIIMDEVLAEMQKAGDADIPKSKSLFEKHQLKIYEHPVSQRDEFEATQGKISKTIDVKNRVVGKYAAYLWMISPDKVNWYVGAFANVSTSTVVDCNNQPLVKGKTYYLKSQTFMKGEYSNWSQIVEVVCI